MGLFKKKSDPISDRARVLSEEIAALEAQIQKLSAQPNNPRAPSQVNHHPQTAPPAPVPPASQPRLRSTALPQHRHALLPHAVSTPVVHEPVFEEVDHKGLQSSPRVIPPGRTEELGFANMI